MTAFRRGIMLLILTVLLSTLVAPGQLTAQADPALEQGYRVYDLDFPVLAGRGGVTNRFPLHATAADAFAELKRCFNCSFPGPGAPAQFPADGQRMDLQFCPPRTPTKFCLPAPVRTYFKEAEGVMYFVAQGGHYDGGGSVVYFQFYADAQGVLHLRVRAYASDPFGGLLGPSGLTLAKITGELAWPIFALTLGGQMFEHTCNGSFTCPGAASPEPSPNRALDLRFNCPTLRQGSTGPCVELLQKLLNGQDARLTIDGVFGSDTDAAVRSFQSRSGLGVDGIVGPDTASALYEKPNQSFDLRTDCGVLAQGSSGPCVTQLQKLLNSKGANLAVDGSFGSNTDAAVRSFQSDNGLTVDGIVGPNTKAALYDGGGGTHSVDLRTDCGVLAQGSSGPCVIQLQELLNSKGANLAIDGVFGSDTDAAVRSFQSSHGPQSGHGLVVDGIVGLQTTLTLYAGGVSGVWGGVDLRFDCGTLQEGSTSDCVVELQNLLRKQGASIVVDGIFGPATDAAVRNFQSSNGLTVDGTVGPNTKEALYGAAVPNTKETLYGAAVPTTLGAPIDYGKVVTVARTFVQEGVPYVWGGGHFASPGPSRGTCVGYTGTSQPCPASSTIGLDSSGLVRWVYWLAAGIDLGNGGNTDFQFSSPHVVRISELQKQPGDLEFFGSSSNTFHVVIYSGVENGVPMMIETNKAGTNAHEVPLRKGGLWVRVVGEVTEPVHPDLVVRQINVTGNEVQVVIANEGNAAVPAANGFWVDVYIDPRTPPIQPNDIWNSFADEGLVWGVDGDVLPMEPGEVITLTLGDAFYWPTLSNFSGSVSPGASLYAQVDSANTETTYGGVLESHEAIGGIYRGAPYNNVTGPVLATKGAARLEVYLPLVNTQGLASAATDAPVHTLPLRTELEKEN